MAEETRSTFTSLVCSACDLKHDINGLQNLCHKCGKPLLALYDLKKAAITLNRSSLKDNKINSMWRYEEVLPVKKRKNVVSLKEGWTNLATRPNLGERLGCPGVKVYIKDESTNPTSSFKARGLSCAVSKALELGAKTLAVPSAGNAAGASSAYAALCDLPLHVFMPKDVPIPFRAECLTLGANVELVNGLINDCGAKVAEGVKKHGWFALSTLKEPYRLEGKKTMGYEIIEQLGWKVPDVVIYPTGGGTGLVAMWRAFHEMEQLGLIGSERPRMVSVQSSGCAPIVAAYNEGKQYATKWQDAKTVADGLRVPEAIGDFLILNAVRESNGTALTVTDAEMLVACKLLGKHMGIFAAPEGGAAVSALTKLYEQKWIKHNETVVVFNTGSGTKYAHAYL